MVDIAELADRAAAGTEALAKLGARVARGIAVFGAILTALCVLIAITQMDGGGRALALILTIAAAAFGFAAPLLAWWRLSRVGGSYQSLANEFRLLFDRDETAGRIVVDTVVHGETPNAPATTMRGATQFGSVRAVPLDRLRGLVHLTDAFAALARFPVLLLFGVLGLVGLVGLTLIFALASLL